MYRISIFARSAICGPINDISPSNTFKSRGNSSMLVDLNGPPIGVTRASLRIGCITAGPRSEHPNDVHRPRYETLDATEWGSLNLDGEDTLTR